MSQVQARINYPNTFETKVIIVENLGSKYERVLIKVEKNFENDAAAEAFINSINCKQLVRIAKSMLD